jgi:nucleotide-binding universal stress UspA family protein
MKTIIVPTDFSPIATNALHYALDLAKSINASIILFHVYQVPVSFTDAPILLMSVDDLRKNAIQKILTLKEEVEHISGGNIKIYEETVLGNIEDELETLCNKMKPFAVVMGTKGAGAVERALFGSNTLNAIKHLTWPVICVPPGKTFGQGIKKVGFACDLKNVVESIPASQIINFVKMVGAKLYVMTVDYENKHGEGETPQQSALLQAMLAELEPSYHFIQYKDVEDGINYFAEQNDLDLILAIPKKHKLLDAIFKQSSSKQLVYQSRVPVLCVHEE